MSRADPPAHLSGAAPEGSLAGGVTGFSAPFARVVIDYVQAQGIDPAPLHQVLALGPAQLADPSVRVPSRTLAQALSVAARLCNDPLVGLRVGAFVRPAHLGALGYALMSCAEGRTGLAMFEQMQTLLCNEIVARHSVSSQQIETQQELLGPVPRDTGFWIFFVACRLAFPRWVSGRDMNPLQIDLPCPPPADEAPLRQFVGGPIRFDAASYREVLPADWLDWINPNADPTVHGLMRSMASTQWQATVQDADEVLAVLSQRIAACLQEGDVPTLQTMAHKMSAPTASAMGAQVSNGPSMRQLQRRLAEQGLSFKDLVERVRKEQALGQLRHTDLPLAEVARRVGYAEPSSFHRAVRRWTGLTPLAVRQQAKGGPGQPGKPGHASNTAGKA